MSFFLGNLPASLLPVGYTAESTKWVVLSKLTVLIRKTINISRPSNKEMYCLTASRNFRVLSIFERYAFRSQNTSYLFVL